MRKSALLGLILIAVPCAIQAQAADSCNPSQAVKAALERVAHPVACGHGLGFPAERKPLKSMSRRLVERLHAILFNEPVAVASRPKDGDYCEPWGNLRGSEKRLLKSR
jgi:hypothetical protein